METADLIILILTGATGGVLSGMLGVGGGVIYILVLPMILQHAGFTDAEVVPYIVTNSLFATFIAGLINVIILIRSGFFFYRAVFWTSLDACIAAVIVYFFILPQPWYSKDVFTILIILLLIPMSFQLIRPASQSSNQTHKDELKPLQYSLAGTLGGLITSLSGLGGGLVVVPVMNVIMKLDIKKASSVSLGMVTIVSLLISLINFFQHHELMPSTKVELHTIGFLIPEISLWLVAGVLVGAPMGSFFAKKASVGFLKKSFGIFLIIVIIKKVFDLV